MVLSVVLVALGLAALCVGLVLLAGWPSLLVVVGLVLLVAGLLVVPVKPRRGGQR